MNPGADAPTAGPAAEREVVTVGGRRVTLTHLDKVMYPETGTTKADILGYYATVADALIRHARDRPATRKRWVHGVGTPEEPGQVFFQKNLGDGTPDWVKRREVPHKSRTTVYPLVNDLPTLTWLAQIGTLEIHVPQWCFDPAGKPAHPDRLVLDLDPGEGVGLAECAEVARWARALLLDMGLETVPVTSGSKGIHLYAALDGDHSSDQVSEVAHELARALEADHPGEVLSAMTRSLRTGKVFVDWSQNSKNKTTIAPYSLRGQLRPLVAAPRTWRELESPGLEQLDYRQVLKRLERRADPLAAVAEAIEAHGSVRGARLDSDAPDRLHTYRSKRDANRTPEPVPGAAPAGASGIGGAAFVIQEHHARALHFDLRLEHDGVLASWALPKGVPTDPTHNHLAVHTEDHPMEYLEFEGTIPAGEYGAGSMSIWDSGRYVLEKWRDDEVIVTLHGRPDGGLAGAVREFALIRTGGGESRNWLIHLMKPKRADPVPEPAAAGAPADLSTPATVVAQPAARTLYSPMLARPGSLRELSDSDWAYEMKWDGIRMLAYLDGGPDGSVRFLTRNGNDVTPSFPELVEDLRTALGRHAAVLDGEVVALDRANRPDFSLLQTRLGLTGDLDVRRAQRGAPVHYFVFDLLEHDGAALVERPYSERRTALDSLVAGTGTVQVPPAFDGEAAEVLATSARLGLEGLIAKENGSSYQSGRRSDRWVKIKHVRAQEVVIGGWRPGNGHRGSTLGSLLVGVPVPRAPGEPGPLRLRYAGRIGSGFRDRDLTVLRRRLDELATADNPFDDVPAADAGDAGWVRPLLVGEAEFAEWTPGGRLRHPTWRGLRVDKDPGDVAVEDVLVEDVDVDVQDVVDAGGDVARPR
ncbi:ATP-dependent DNA ligase [Cryobacterium sp.]|jgi:bifunctional non-homologous end joining protein LigD|uniref:ATP-dependent DNA ligase n=1 Tax=Cryobacterium sp. TaxID=1926290 RepID=UPI002625951A|nr:ATP-dependent DNA ligase [Cryobacterium sp.]MCU1447154.1 ATP-dependent ligase [Cryobacterium sp.]